MKVRRLWAIGVLFIAVLIVACGGDDDDAGGQVRTATGTATAAASEFAAFDCDGEYPGTDPDATDFPLDLADDAGETVSLEEPPAAIVSLSAAHVEVLYAIGAGDQLVAGDKFSDCPKAASDLEQLDSFQPSVEAITALEPDLVLLAFPNPDLQEALDGVGVPSMLLGIPDSVSGVIGQIQTLGRVVGHVKEATTLAGAMERRIDEIVQSLPDVEAPPKVFHEVDNTLFTVGPGSFVGDMYEILKVENIAGATGEAFPQMAQEAIIEAAPDVIILADEVAGESPATVKARPGWDAIPAVQNDRIYTVDPDIVSRPGPRVVEALETLAGLLYGE